MNPGYRVPPQNQQEQDEREDYYKKARESRKNEIQTMDQQELARAQAEGRTPTDVQQFGIGLPLLYGASKAIPWAIGALGLGSSAYAADRAGFFDNINIPTTDDVRSYLTPRIASAAGTVAGTASDWFQRAKAAIGDMTSPRTIPQENVGDMTNPRGNPDPEPDPEPPTKTPWVKIGLGTIGSTIGLTSGLRGFNDAADRAAANESQDATVAQSPSLEDPSSFLNESADEVEAQTLQDIQDNLALQQVGAQESYSNLYARALQNAYRRSAASTSPFTGVSGGQPAQTQQALSAAEISQLGDIGSSYNQAMRDIESMRIAAPQEARQAGVDQYFLQQSIIDRNFEMAVRLNDTLNDPNASDEDSIRIFNSLGIYDQDEINRLLDLQEENTDSWWRSLWDTIYRVSMNTVNSQPSLPGGP